MGYWPLGAIALEGWGLFFGPILEGVGVGAGGRNTDKLSHSLWVTGAGVCPRLEFGMRGILFLHN